MRAVTRHRSAANSTRHSGIFFASPMLLATGTPLAAQQSNASDSAANGCTGDNGGLTLPQGFCATVFADNIGHARHLAVAPNGVVYVNTWSGTYYGKDKVPDGGFLVALRDSTGDGHADEMTRFGPGVAEGNEGGTGLAIFISDDQHGRIWRVSYHGDARADIQPAAAPGRGASVSTAEAQPPEGTHPDAGTDAGSLPVPPGATAADVVLGGRIYNDQVGSAPCSGCHGLNAKGSPLGPNLTSSKWLWGDGSLASITKIITDGVSNPKNYRSPMPPMGGADLKPAEVEAVAAYVWAISKNGVN